MNRTLLQLWNPVRDIARFAAVVSLFGVSLWGYPARSYPRSSVPQRSPLVQAPFETRLLGQWSSPDALGGEPLTFVFTPENTLYFIVTLPRGRMAAEEFGYRVTAGSPLALDVILPDGSVVATIAELTPDGKLRVQLEGTNPGEPRPTAFSDTAVLFDRVSEDTTLPAALVEANAIDILLDLSRAQRTYYLEFRTFASSAEPLNSDVPLETDDYSFEIDFPIDPTDSVRIIATPKRDDLHSFSSGVFMVPNERGFEISMVAVCRSDTPSIVAPEMPVPPPDSSGEIACAPESHLIER
ncbi:MAG: type IV pilin-like G/H family protein [Cyanobacteria bacterium SID2]|nr:type IV pilin-like G/H family protein [Cyanobacteria bacterium SID2]MBP0006701.1 type IV pilin-like G/H family protein [Cyanobacteria bacterium SBC]